MSESRSRLVDQSVVVAVKVSECRISLYYVKISPPVGYYICPHYIVDFLLKPQELSFIRTIFCISGAGFETCSFLYVQFNVGLKQSYGVATPVINM
jgi:hypothetical protein